MQMIFSLGHQGPLRSLLLSTMNALFLGRTLKMRRHQKLKLCWHLLVSLRR